MSDIATMAGIQAGAGVLGMIAGNAGRKNQMRDQRQLMDIQMQNQMQLNRQGQEIALQNWEKTNYDAQVKQMEKAGLNVGMMYGGQGQGGTLTGGSGGSASGGNAPSGNIPMELMAQMAQIASQTKLNNAQAEKIETETKKIGGVDTQKTSTEIESLTQGIQNQKAVAELTRTQNDIAGLEYELRGATIEKAKELVNQEVIKLEKTNYILEKQGLITKTEAENVVEKTKLQLVGMQLDNILKQSQNENIKANTEKIKEETSVIFRDYLLRVRNTDVNEKRQLTEQTSQELGRILQEKGLNQAQTKMYLDAIIGTLTMGAYGKGVERTSTYGDKGEQYTKTK